MKQFKEVQIENTFEINGLIGLGNGYRLREHAPDSPCVKDGKLGVVYDFWQLIYIEDGSYVCQIDGNPPCRLEKGQLLFCAPMQIRFSYNSSTTVAGIVSFRCVSPKMRFLKNRIFTLPDEERLLLAAAFQKGAEIRRRQENIPSCGACPFGYVVEHQLQALKNYIELLLISLYDRLDHTDPQSLLLQNQLNYYEEKFRLIEDFMKKNLHRNLTVDEILLHTGFSLSTVKRIFQIWADCGIIHYFLKLKINEAKWLLCQTELTVTQIAERLGFSSVHYFSNIFKKFTGISPNGYARAAANESQWKE